MSSELEIWLAMALALVIPIGAAAYGVWSLRQSRKEMRRLAIETWGTAD